MKRSTTFAQAIFCLITLLTLSFATNATVPSDLEPFGGIRSLIQLRTSGGEGVELEQTVAEHLDITIVDEDGIVVSTSTTEDVNTFISTAELESGEYTLQSVNDQADYQEHSFTVE